MNPLRRRFLVVITAAGLFVTLAGLGMARQQRPASMPPPGSIRLISGYHTEPNKILTPLWAGFGESMG